MLFVTVFLAFFAAIASAIPVRVGKMIAKRDVWAPKVLSPTEGSVWMVGDRLNVTWYVISRSYGCPCTDALLASGTQPIHQRKSPIPMAKSSFATQLASSLAQEV
jgi:hypothetical protein